jgi:hypothetical protein
MKNLPLLLSLMLVAGCAQPPPDLDDPQTKAACRASILLVDEEVIIPQGSKNVAGTASGRAHDVRPHLSWGRINATLEWQPVYSGAERMRFAVDTEGARNSVFAEGASPLSLSFERDVAIGDAVTFLINPDDTLEGAVLLMDQPARLVVHQEVPC